MTLATPIVELLVVVLVKASFPLHYFDQRLVEIIHQVELWSPRQVTGYTFTPCEIFHFPWHRHQIEGTNGFLVSLPKDTGKVG